MQASGREQPRIPIGAAFLFGGCAIGGAFLDLVSKSLVFRFLENSLRHEVIPGVLNLALSVNRGGLWGIMQGRTGLFILFSLAAMAVIIWMFLSCARMTWPLAAGLGLVMGGAMGNLWDRIQQGGVRDFLDFHVSRHHWPTFNLADVFICMGALTLILHTLGAGQREAEPLCPGPESAENGSKAVERNTASPGG